MDATTARSPYIYRNCMVCTSGMDIVLGGLLTLWVRIRCSGQPHGAVMVPTDNDVHDSRCAVNHYYASLSAFSDKFAVEMYTV